MKAHSLREKRTFTQIEDCCTVCGEWFPRRSTQRSTVCGTQCRSIRSNEPSLVSYEPETREVIVEAEVPVVRCVICGTWSPYPQPWIKTDKIRTCGRGTCQVKLSRLKKQGVFPPFGVREDPETWPTIPDRKTITRAESFHKLARVAANAPTYREALYHLTMDREVHPSGWDGPCACATCRASDEGILGPDELAEDEALEAASEREKIFLLPIPPEALPPPDRPPWDSRGKREKPPATVGLSSETASSSGRADGESGGAGDSVAASETAARHSHQPIDGS